MSSSGRGGDPAPSGVVQAFVTSKFPRFGINKLLLFYSIPQGLAHE